MNDNTKTLIANLKKAAFDRETLVIGGGIFRPDELREAVPRIAACVNACEGMKTESIEAYGARIRNSRELQDQIETLLEQRDELLAALERMPRDDVGMVEHNPDEGESFFCCGAETSVNHGRLNHKPGCWYANLRKVYKVIAKASG